MKYFELLNGDCLEILKAGPDNSVDALITDPPAGISFMGKEWDEDKGGRDQWVAWMTEVMRECHRVLKPGGHGLVWAIPRTSHWTATALENAGFEIRDVVTHLFGTGFPKSMDISKAIDKAAKADRPVVGTIKKSVASMGKGEGNFSDDNYEWKSEFSVTAPATDAAKQWQGWGTALKPASEHWILIRKPLSESTVAKNVLKHGTGGLNIDGCRIGTEEKLSSGRHITGDQQGPSGYKTTNRTEYQQSPQGRFPANLVLSHNPDCEEKCTEGCAVAMLDAQSGYLHASGNKKIGPAGKTDKSLFGIGSVDGRASDYKDGGGGASRFFYCAKASTSEKNRGLEDKAAEKVNDGRETPIDNPFQRGETLRKNTHPTVKSIKLMEYLVTLITPKGGTILDPFMGSGSTGVAAKNLGFGFIGIEKEEEYLEIAKKRIEAA